MKKKQTKTGNTDMVPPAFTEVWQLMFECVLNHFKHDTEHGAQPPVTYYQRLQSQHTPVIAAVMIQLAMKTIT